MGSLSIAAPQANVMPPQDAEALALVRDLQQAAKTYRSCLAHIAYSGWRLRYRMGGSAGNKGELWPTIGFDSEDAFRESLGIPQSTWYAQLSIGQALCNLSLAEMQQIAPTNAKLLTLVEPAIVGDYPWVEEAKSLSPGEFAENVAKRNKQAGSDREPSTVYRCKVPITAKRFLEDTVEKFRVEHELASSGEALEMLIADVHDRPNAMTTMKTAHQLITWALGRVQKRAPESKEVQWLIRAERMLYKTYSAVRMESHEEDAQEVYPAEELYGGKERPTGPTVLSAKPYGSNDPPKPGRPVMEGASEYVFPLLAPDEFGGSDDGFEDGDEG